MQRIHSRPEQDLRLAVSCTSGQMGTASACANVIGGMREIGTSSVRWRGVERQREALRGSGQASLAHKGREPFDFAQDKRASALQTAAAPRTTNRKSRHF